MALDSGERAYCLHRCTVRWVESGSKWSRERLNEKMIFRCLFNSFIFEIQVCRASSARHGGGCGRFIDSHSSDFRTFSWSGKLIYENE